ncbi:hypothetical protein PAE9249_04960 [Paenibacillus sp. CECT 9249]|uniref:hypothetical protein n=1 Tax=Paenibacillus sp. CECT 9249 TaxID=2845385 RepID=UPI001E42098D|nr:hypothetical protein [Paenibacillus sp. CECT 9249]CAH0122410.1 hypothetical protein PAE9249_04960 [Paenibacillus sp. CECT 9249]
MKKLMAALFMAIFLCSSLNGATFAFGGENVNREKLKDSKDQEQIVNLADDIVQFVNSVVPDSNVNREITQSDIHFDDAVKIYVDLDVFRIENTKEELKRRLETAEYMWELPIYVDSSTIMVNISRVKKATDDVKPLLTPEQIEYAEINEGNWEVAGVKTYPMHINYFEYNMDHLNKISPAETPSNEVYMIGGIPNVRIPVILLVDEAIEQVIFTSKPVAPENIDSKSLSSYNNLQSNTAYSFDEVASFMKQLPADADQDVATGAIGQESAPKKDNLFIYAGVGVVAILIIAFVVYRKFQTKS